MFDDVPREMRRELLKPYGFICQCEACINNWPMYSDLVKRKTEFFKLVWLTYTKFIMGRVHYFMPRLVYLFSNSTYFLYCTYTSIYYNFALSAIFVWQNYNLKMFLVELRRINCFHNT